VSSLIEVETERLRLRQWLPADREPFAALNADPRVMAFFPAQFDRAESDAVADRLQARIAEVGWGLWAAEIRESGEFIGFVGLHVPGEQLPFFPCVEIGWRLGFRHWGRGFATEAARAALRVGFERVGLPDIVSFAALENARSRAVMARIGLRDTGITFDHPDVPAGSQLREHCLYRLSHEEWAAALKD
jgi:RimJ/RimL family protein N-acetyltransferase